MTTFVHFFRADQRENRIDHQRPNAHVYINPAAVAYVVGRSLDLTTITFLDSEDYEIVEGFAADVVQALQSSSEEQ